MKYKFSHYLVLGHQQIDEEHEEILVLLNNLLESQEKKLSPAHLTTALKDILKCVDRHFANEESIMVQLDFPDYEDHKKKHTQFIKVFAGFLDETKVDGFDAEALMSKIQIRAMDLLVVHVKVEDRKLVNYINSK